MVMTIMLLSSEWHETLVCMKSLLAWKLQRHIACCMAANWDIYPDAGISGLSNAEHAESFQEANEQQPKQEQRHEANGVLPQPSAEQAVKQVVRLEPKAEPPQPPQLMNLYPNFPMPPEMPLGAGPSIDAWQRVEQADAGFMQQGRQPRGRQQQARRMQGRKREHSPGWSPIGVHVQKRIRCGSCAAFKVPRQLRSTPTGYPVSMVGAPLQCEKTQEGQVPHCQHIMDDSMHTSLHAGMSTPGGTRI